MSSGWDLNRKLREIELEASEGRFDFEVTTEEDFISDLALARFKGYVWGERLGAMRITTPASPWDNVKDLLRRRTPLTFLEPRMRDLRLVVFALYPDLVYAVDGNLLTVSQISSRIRDFSPIYGGEEESRLEAMDYQETLLHKVPFTLSLAIPNDLGPEISAGERRALKAVLKEVIAEGFNSPTAYVVREPVSLWDAVKAWLNHIGYKISRRLPWHPAWPSFSYQERKETYSLNGLELGRFIKYPTLCATQGAEARLILVLEEV